MESKLEGNWQMVRAELAGEAAPELVTTNMMLTLALSGYEVRYGGIVSDRGTFVVDATTDQRTLLLTGVEGPNAERTIPCIFQLTGDRLRVCYGLDGILPEGFNTQAGEARYLATYRRTTPPEPAPAAEAPLSAEEQMERFAEDLKENDWGHQPC